MARKKKSTESGSDLFKYVPLALFLLALIVRLYFWPDGLFHTDSVIAVAEAEHSVADGKLYYLQGLGYPGYAAVTSGLFWVYHTLTGATSAESLLIFSSLFFGSLSVYLLYVLALKLTSSKLTAIFSALVLCFMPLHLSLSTYVKDQMLGVCFMLASLILALKAGESGRLKYKVLAAAVMGYTIAIRQQEFLLIPAFLMLYVYASNPVKFSKNKGGYKISLNRPLNELVLDALVFAVVILSVFVAAFVPRMISEPGFNLVDALLVEGSRQGDGITLYSPLLTDYSIPWATKTITYLGWGVLFASIYLNYQRNRLVWAAMMCWMVPYFLILGNFQQVSPYFIFPAFIPAAFFIGWGLEYAAKKWKPEISYVVLAVLIIWMLSNIAPLLEYRSQYCGPCEFAKKIGELTPEGSRVHGGDESRHYEYYAKRSGSIGRANPLNLTDLELHFLDLRAKLANGTSLYITSAGLAYDFLPQGIVVPNPQNPSVLFNKANLRQYSNLRFDPQSQTLVDAQTNTILPVTGLYSLELFNEFKTTLVATVENEDWHHKSLDFGKYQSSLFRLELRENTT